MPPVAAIANPYQRNSVRPPSVAATIGFTSAKSSPSRLIGSTGGHCACGGTCPRCQSSGTKYAKSTGNHAEQPRVQADAQDFEEGLTEATSPRFGQDFSRIAIHPSPVGVIQTKLAINTPGDSYEQEADRVAAHVLRMSVSAPTNGCPCGGGCPKCRAMNPDHRSRHSPSSARDTTDHVTAVMRSQGQPLDAATRAFMEPRFGRDFSEVRVHRDAAASQSARAVNARAYTVDSHIVFGASQFAPETSEGRRLLAHELTHVVQQSGAANADSQEGFSTMAAPRRGPMASLGGARDAISTVARGTLQRDRADSDDGRTEHTKVLRKGTMKWVTVPTNDEDQPIHIQVSFTPRTVVRGRTITFLQTKVQSRSGENAAKRPKLDVHFKDFVPFYGANWDPKIDQWESEGAAPGFKSQPSSATDSTGYAYDFPLSPPGQTKRFETVAVVAETSEVLGALRWGIGGGKLLGAEDEDCTDTPSAEFAPAVDRFYAAPSTVGSDPEREAWYDAILDEFGGGDATLTDSHKKQLNPIAAEAKRDPNLLVMVLGFGDAMDRDPADASQQRVGAVSRYLVSQGVRKESLEMESFGASWARALPSMKEGRNRRVQVRLHYK